MQETENITKNLEGLTPEESAKLIELERSVALDEARPNITKNFLSFVKYVWPEFIEGSHHKIINKKFNDLAEGKIPRFTSSSLRERSVAQLAIAEAEVRLRSARALVMELVAAMWQKVLEDEEISLKERALFQIACSDGARAAAESVDRVCDAAGTSGNFKGHPLERIARDVRVVRQHLTVASHHIEDGGRVLLGLPATGMMLRS